MSKYLYNGIELPEPPDYDKTAFPYCYIYDATLYYAFVASPIPLYDTTITYVDGENENTDGSTYLSTGSYEEIGALICSLTRSAGAKWDSYSTRMENIFVSGTALWTNTDLFRCTAMRVAWNNLIWTITDELVLSASDPVPVGGEPEEPETPEEPEPETAPQDFYIVKNGVGQKQDFYLRVGGQSVKLDEYKT